jgi:hypothetical protein
MMRYLRVSATMLQAATYHPRRATSSAKAGLAASIERFGLVQPIVWNERTGHVVGGHQRLDVLRQLGVEETEVVVVDLDETEEKALNLALNNPAIAGEFTPAVEEIIAELRRDAPDLVADLRLEEILATLGEGSEDEPHGVDDFVAGVLANRWGVPPFSVLDGRSHRWIERKQAWLGLGIESEAGRDGHLLMGEFSMSGVPHFAKLPRVSIFDPVLAELAYRWFAPRGGMVLDPFAGGSVRGIVAAVLGLRYVGVELRPEQVEANLPQWTRIAGEREPAPRWIVGDSAEVIGSEGCCEPVDFVFSCPPYFDLERYSDDPRDLSNMGYDGFLAMMGRIVERAVGLLRDDRFACFVLGDVRDRRTGMVRGMVADVVARFERAGARLYNDAVYLQPLGTAPARSRQFTVARKLIATHQRVLVFVKGDPRKATEAVGGWGDAAWMEELADLEAGEEGEGEGDGSG